MCWSIFELKCDTPGALEQDLQPFAGFGKLSNIRGYGLIVWAP
jgi:hypothetical protein